MLCLNMQEMSSIRSVSGGLQPSACKDVSVSRSTLHLLWIVSRHTRLVGSEVGWGVEVWGMGEVPNTPGFFERTASAPKHPAIFFWPCFEL